MRKLALVTTVIAGVAVSAPAFAQAQQQQQPTGQIPSQRLTQEQAVNAGTPLFVSPAIVRQVQQALNRAGYDTGNVDGVWSRQTAIAAMNFQQANGLEPTGNLNVSTLAALGLGLDEIQQNARRAQQQTGGTSAVGGGTGGQGGQQAQMPGQQGQQQQGQMPTQRLEQEQPGGAQGQTQGQQQ